MREKLGLKPLNTAAAADRAVHVDPKREAEAAAAQQEQAALKDRIAEFKQRRQLEEELRRAKWLGVKEGADDDDVAAWVQKSRAAETAVRAQEEAKVARLRKILADEDSGSGEEEDEPAAAPGGAAGGPAKPGYSSAELKGLRVAHGAEDFKAGETMVMTLEDQNILDDAGELNAAGDALQVAALAEDRQRAIARAKAAPRGGREEAAEELEQGAILAKYDEEAKEARMTVSMTIGGRGQISGDALKTVQSAKLEAQRKRFEGRRAQTLDTVTKVMADTYNAEELGQMMQKAKKFRRKKKKKATKLTAKDLDALETAEAAGAARPAAAAAPVPAAAPAPVAALKDSRRAAYGRALETSAAAGKTKAEAAEGAATAKAKRGKDFVLEQMRRRQGQASELDESNQRLYQGNVFTETTEFANSIRHTIEQEQQDRADKKHKAEPAAPAPAAGPGPSAMDVDEAAAAEPAAKKAAVVASGMEGSSKGLGGMLQMLQRKGELKDTINWAGRTNDKKFTKVRDVTSSFDDSTRFARDVEKALTRKDEFGRVMTPKESFREFCHQFHGIAPSKNKAEKKIRQYKEEQRTKKLASGDTPLHMMKNLKTAQKKNKTAYLVLDGAVKPGQDQSRQED